MAAPVELDDFDVAMQPGLREKLAEVYREFRAIQAGSQASMADPGRRMVRSVCPGCGVEASESDFLFEKNEIPHVRCRNCHLAYAQQTLTASDDEALYDDSQFMRAYVALKLHPLYARLETDKARYLLQRVQAHQPDIKTVLDIGASTGAAMAATGLQGLDGYGIEPDRAMAEPLRRRYPQRFVNGYFPRDLPASWPDFDLITLLDVLEHMVDPLGFLEAVGAKLAPGGMLLIQVPNFNSLLVQLEGSKNSNFCVGHWQHFTGETLQKLLARAGFRALELGNCISELDRVQAYPAEQVRMVTEALLGRSEPVDTPDQLFQHGLGYKLYGIFSRA